MCEQRRRTRAAPALRPLEHAALCGEPDARAVGDKPVPRAQRVAQSPQHDALEVRLPPPMHLWGARCF